MRWLFRLCIMAFASVLVLSSCSNHRHFSVAIIDVNIVDPKTGAVERKSIGIRDGLIEAVAHAPVSGEMTIDGANLWAVPGLWDMHVHITHPNYFGMFLSNGVVGVRDMGGGAAEPTDGCESVEIRQLQKWRAAIEAKELAGPRIVLAGPQASGTDWPTALAATTPAEAREAVSSIKESGADFVKIYEDIPRNAFAALMEEAKRNDLVVAGHVSEETLNILDAIQSGQRSIEHVRSHFIVCFAESDAELEVFYEDNLWTQKGRQWGASHRALCPQIWRALNENDVWITPTLAVEYTWRDGEREEFDRDPRRSSLPKSIKDSVADFSVRLRNRTHSERSESRVWRDALLKFVSRARAENAKMLAGSDAACEGVIPGFGLHDQLALMVAAGLTPLEALQTATIEPANYFGAANRRGRILPGYDADILLLRSDPRSSIAALKELEMLILRGELFDRHALDQIAIANDATVDH